MPAAPTATECLHSLDMGLSAFVTLQATSGKAGTKVGIMGQGFDSTSVVKLGGVAATTVTLTGTTYITATVPAGVTRLCSGHHRRDHAHQHEEFTLAHTIPGASGAADSDSRL